MRMTITAMAMTIITPQTRMQPTPTMATRIMTIMATAMARMSRTKPRGW